MDPLENGAAVTLDLSPREMEVVRAYLKADNADAAGAELGITGHTVRVHYANVRDRTGLSRAELTLLLLGERRRTRRNVDEMSMDQLAMAL